jgi:hypothetical protein
MIICHFRISIAEDNEISSLVFKNNARRGLLALRSNGKTILGTTKKKIWTTLL